MVADPSGSAALRCQGVLTCPVCAAALRDEGATLRCAAGHAFDRAREGYVHLLPSGHGRSKRHGDADEMVRARRRFLEAGHYEPLSDAVNRLAHRWLESAGETTGRAPTLLEAGCGDGYYIGRLASALASGPGPRPCALGFDLSRDAVRLAARRYPEVFFFVNDVTHRLSVADAAVDVLLDLFAPRNAEEFARVVRPGGGLVVGIPGGDHLAELRATLPLLGIQADKRERTIERLDGAFEPVAEERVHYRTELDGGTVADLVRMTPSYWHLDEATLAEASRSGPRPVTIAVRLLGFRRR